MQRVADDCVVPRLQTVPFDHASECSQTRVIARYPTLRTFPVFFFTLGPISTPPYCLLLLSQYAAQRCVSREGY